MSQIFTGMKKSQNEGAVAVVTIIVAVYTVALIISLFQTPNFSISYEDKSYGPLIVAISGNTDFNGVYYMPGEARIRDLLTNAGIGNLEDLTGYSYLKYFSTGDMIVIESGNQVIAKEMSNAQKVALNIAININKAELGDFTLIPGIGEKTAWQIIQFREKSGRIERLEDLMKIPGIKEKKFKKIKKYLCTSQIS